MENQGFTGGIVRNLVQYERSKKSVVKTREFTLMNLPMSSGKRPTKT